MACPFHWLVCSAVDTPGRENVPFVRVLRQPWSHSWAPVAPDALTTRFAPDTRSAPDVTRNRITRDSGPCLESRGGCGTRTLTHWHDTRVDADDRIQNIYRYDHSKWYRWGLDFLSYWNVNGFTSNEPVTALDLSSRTCDWVGFMTPTLRFRLDLCILNPRLERFMTVWFVSGLHFIYSQLTYKTQRFIAVWCYRRGIQL